MHPKPKKTRHVREEDGEKVADEELAVKEDQDELRRATFLLILLWTLKVELPVFLLQSRTDIS